MLFRSLFVLQLEKLDIERSVGLNILLMSFDCSWWCTAFEVLFLSHPLCLLFPRYFKGILRAGNVISHDVAFSLVFNFIS